MSTNKYEKIFEHARKNGITLVEAITELYSNEELNDLEASLKKQNAILKEKIHLKLGALPETTPKFSVMSSVGHIAQNGMPDMMEADMLELSGERDLRPETTHLKL